MSKSVLQIVDAAYLAEVKALREPHRKMSRIELLTIQYTKCINYFRHDVSPLWGGEGHERESKNIESCFQRFLEDCDASNADSLPPWINKKLQAVPWGPENVELSFTACRELGYPVEPYLTLNGGILTMLHASRLLCIDAGELIKLKCALLFDGLVVDHAIKRMLRPRSEWPRIQLKRGGKGRSYRLVDPTV